MNRLSATYPWNPHVNTLLLAYVTWMDVKIFTMKLHGWCVPPYLAFFKCIHFSRGKKYGRVLEKKLKNSLSNPRWQMSSYFSVTLIHSLNSCFPYKLRIQLHYLASYLFAYSPVQLLTLPLMGRLKWRCVQCPKSILIGGWLWLCRTKIGTPNLLWDELKWLGMDMKIEVDWQILLSSDTYHWIFSPPRIDPICQIKQFLGDTLAHEHIICVREAFIKKKKNKTTFVILGGGGGQKFSKCHLFKSRV